MLPTYISEAKPIFLSLSRKIVNSRAVVVNSHSESERIASRRNAEKSVSVDVIYPYIIVAPLITPTVIPTRRFGRIKSCSAVVYKQHSVARFIAERIAVYGFFRHKFRFHPRAVANARNVESRFGVLSAREREFFTVNRRYHSPYGSEISRSVYRTIHNSADYGVFHGRLIGRHRQRFRRSRDNAEFRRVFFESFDVSGTFRYRPVEEVRAVANVFAVVYGGFVMRNNRFAAISEPYCGEDFIRNGNSFVCNPFGSVMYITRYRAHIVIFRACVRNVANHGSVAVNAVS